MNIGIRNLFKRESTAANRAGKEKGSESADYRQNIVYVNTDEKAMKIAAVYRAVNLISSSVAILKMQYKRKDRAKDYFKLYNKGEGATINYLLGVRPNERINSYTFFKYLVAQMLLRGNAYIYIKRGMLGEIEALYLCSPGTVVYDVFNNTYTISDSINGIYGKYDSEEVIHIKNVSRDGGYTGMSTIHYAALTLGIVATGENETLKRFATGGRFKAFLQNKIMGAIGWGEYQDKQLQGQALDLQDTINQGGDIFAVKGDSTITPISMSSADMQFLERTKFNIREIARFFNVPPNKLMDDTNANYKSVEISNIAFYAEALQPIVMEIEREFTAKLLNVNTYLDYKYCFDLSALYALDLDSKAKWNRSRLENGQCSPNDLRREDDKEPVKQGDEVYLSVNFAPLGSPKLNGETVNKKESDTKVINKGAQKEDIENMDDENKDKGEE